MLRLIGLPCLLAACGGSTASDLVAPPDALVVPCPVPVRLPDRALTQAEVEGAWGADRRALRGCGERHALLVAWAQGQVEAGR